MSDDVGQWITPTLEVLARHAQTPGNVASPGDLAQAVERAITAVIVDQRKTLWSGMLGKQVLYPHPSGVSFWVRLGDGISMYAVRSDKDDVATRFILSHLTPGGTFLDVGANTGWFALRAAARYRELGSGSVHAFEPQKVMFDLITRSIAENGLQDLINLHDVALGNEEKTVWMATPAFNSGGATVRFREINESLPVSMTRLDVLKLDTGRIDIMKVDIEGSEPLFIEGAGDFIREHRPKIYSELHPTKLQRVSNRSREDYLQQMQDLGYRVLVLSRSGGTEPLEAAHLEDTRRLLDVVFDPA